MCGYIVQSPHTLELHRGVGGTNHRPDSRTRMPPLRMTELAICRRALDVNLSWLSLTDSRTITEKLNWISAKTPSADGFRNGQWLVGVMRNPSMNATGAP